MRGYKENCTIFLTSRCAYQPLKSIESENTRKRSMAICFIFFAIVLYTSPQLCHFSAAHFRPSHSFCPPPPLSASPPSSLTLSTTHTKCSFKYIFRINSHGKPKDQTQWIQYIYSSACIAKRGIHRVVHITQRELVMLFFIICLRQIKIKFLTSYGL